MLSKEINISNTLIGNEHKPFIIAEAGSNFNQSIDIAKEMIDVALEARCNAIKFQLFRAEYLYPDRGEMYDLFKSIELNPNWVSILSKYCQKKNIIFLASPFDSKSVDVLEDSEIPAYKVASSETTNFKLLRYMALKNKPLIISTGMCDIIDVQEAIFLCESHNNNNLSLLQCGAMYPIPSNQINLNVIQTYKKLFDIPIGFSDHTMNNVAAITSIGLGSSIFEKHFTLSRKLDGPDHSFALEPNELNSYVSDIHEAHISLGTSKKEMLKSEREQGRRNGLYASRTIEKNEVFSEENLKIMRPSKGISDRYKDQVMGLKSNNRIEKDEPINWELIL